MTAESGMHIQTGNAAGLKKHQKIIAESGKASEVVHATVN